MATLEENIKQAIADFDDVKAALEEKGIEVPYDTDTSAYGDFVRTLSSGESERTAYDRGYAQGYAEGDVSGYDRGSEAGKDNGIRAMWEALQAGGTNNDFAKMCNGVAWNKETFKPIYDIISTNGYNATQNCPPAKYLPSLVGNQIDIKRLEEEQGIVFDFSNVSNVDRMCVGALFSAWNVVDIRNVGNLNFTFYGGYIPPDLRRTLTPKRIERLICSEKTKFVTTTFQYAVGYEYIGFEGTIASDINLSWSPLCPESMKKAILCLKNYAGTDEEFSKTITFSEDCWSALETDSTAPDGGSWREYISNLCWNA